MSSVICNALFEDSSVRPSETRGPVSTSKGGERSDCCTSTALTTCGDTNVPVARTPTPHNSLTATVVESSPTETLKSLFGRTSKGTRITCDSRLVLDNPKRTLFPLLKTSLLMFSGLKLGAIERATVSLTVAV